MAVELGDGRGREENGGERGSEDGKSCKGPDCVTEVEKEGGREADRKKKKEQMAAKRGRL